MSSPYYGTTVGAGHFFDLTCYNDIDYSDYSDEPPPDLVLSIDVPAGSQITFQQTTANYNSMYELRWGESCPGETYVACGFWGDSGSVTWVNTESTTQTVYYIQSGSAIRIYHDDSGAFTLDWWFSGELPLPQPCDACAEWRQLSTGVVL